MYSDIGVCAVRCLLIASICLKWCAAFHFDRQLPCHLYDSINITGGIPHANQSITFNNMIFPFDQYATVEFALNGELKPVRTEPHTRGCPCNLRTCIRLCCPYGSFVERIGFEDYKIFCEENPAAKNLQIEMLDTDNQTVTVNIDQYYGYVDNLCTAFYIPEDFEFKLNKSGFVYNGSKWFDHRNYCLKFSDPAKGPLLEALICESSEELESEPDADNVIYASYVPYGMMVSVPFIIATFLVYIFIRELNHFHGRCFMCFLFCLLLYFLITLWARLTIWINHTPMTRKSIGSLIYFLFLSAALWLNVISFDVWHILRYYHRRGVFPNRRQSYFNSIYAYACGLPLIMSSIGCILDSIKSCPIYLKPGIGTDNYFMKEKPWHSKGVFLYLPLCAIFTANVVFFILTITKTHEIEKEKGPSNRRFSNIKNNFILNSQLFNLMGFFWIVEAFSRITLDRKLLLFSDIFNTFLGIIIFLLFVLNPRVQGLIKLRYQEFKTRNISGST